jgi:hypothetical protein
LRTLGQEVDNCIETHMQGIRPQTLHSHLRFDPQGFANPAAFTSKRGTSNPQRRGALICSYQEEK